MPKNLTKRTNFLWVMPKNMTCYTFVYNIGEDYRYLAEADRYSDFHRFFFWFPKFRKNSCFK